MNGTISKFSYQSIQSKEMQFALVNVTQNNVNIGNVPFAADSIFEMILCGMVKVI